MTLRLSSASVFISFKPRAPDYTPPASYLVAVAKSVPTSVRKPATNNASQPSTAQPYHCPLGPPSQSHKVKRSVGLSAETAWLSKGWRLWAQVIRRGPKTVWVVLFLAHQPTSHTALSVRLCNFSPPHLFPLLFAAAQQLSRIRR